MPYPIILCGDHAEFEAQWAASGRPDNERPDWPLPSFDARDWAQAFCKIADEYGFKDAKGEPVDEGWMISWFANALMRGFDHHAAQFSGGTCATPNDPVERCAKIAEPWPGFQLTERSTDADRAVVAVRTEIAQTIRRLNW